MVDIEQKYEPTVKEAALLEILISPEHRFKSITDICKIAGCSRNVYYEAFTKPGFRGLYEGKVKNLVKQSIGPVINTFINEAKRGEFAHGKVILEMAGLYNEKQIIEVGENVVTLSREERQARILELLNKKKSAEAKLPSGGDSNE